MRRLFAIAAALLTIVAIATPAWAGTGKATKAGVTVTLVSTEVEMTGETEATYTITFDVATKNRDIRVSGWPLGPNMGPHNVQFRFMGSTTAMDWTSDVICACEAGGIINVVAGTTERFTLRVVVASVNEPGFLAVRMTGFMWQFVGNDRFWLIKIGGQNKLAFQTDFMFVDLELG